MSELLIKGLLLIGAMVIELLLTVVAIKIIRELLEDEKILWCSCVAVMYFSVLFIIYSIYSYVIKML